MWRIIYKSDHNRVLLIAGSELECYNFLMKKDFLMKRFYDPNNFIVQEL